MNTQKNRFEYRSFLKSVAAIAIPVALQNLLTTTGSMVDTMMIAPLGELSVGAVGLCAQFASLLFSCYWGFTSGGVLFFSQYWGAKDEEGINRSYGMTLSFMVLFGMIFSALALLAPEWVMRVYTDKESLHSIGVGYLRIVAFAYPLQILAMAMSALLRSTERVKIPLIGAIGSVATNILLNDLLIYGHGGFPALGIRGAALATVCAAAVNVLIIAVLARKDGHPYVFAFQKHFRWKGAALAAYFQKCFPIICNELLLGVGNMALNIVLGRQSEQAIAALAVFRTLEGFVIGFYAGFSSSTSILVGAQVGAGRLQVAYERAKKLLILCGCFIFLSCLFLLAVHRPLLTRMGLRGEAYQIGLQMLIVYCAAAVVRMSNWTMNNTFRSAGDPTFGTIMEISFMYAMVLPCVYAAGMMIKAPFLVVFLCCYIDEPIRLFIMYRHLRSGKWIRPVTEAGRTALPAFLKSRKAQARMG
jgi:putative MATE family efflux protein